MKVRLLGCGTSTGVPRVGNDWGLCDPAEPKNRRSRVSILVENSAGSRLLVDTSPDLRNQLLDGGIDRIDAVFWTHDHADHVHGIDDLRVLRYGRAAPIPGYAAEETARQLRLRFGYAFAGQEGYPTILNLNHWNRSGCAPGLECAGARCRTDQRKAPRFGLIMMVNQSVMRQTLVKFGAKWSICLPGWMCWWSIACAATRIQRMPIWRWRWS